MVALDEDDGHPPLRSKSSNRVAADGIPSDGTSVRSPTVPRK